MIRATSFAPAAARQAVVTRAQAADAPPSAAKTGRKASPLERGGTLSGEKAAGKDASAATLEAMKSDSAVTRMAIIDGKFVDDRCAALCLLDLWSAPSMRGLPWIRCLVPIASASGHFQTGESSDLWNYV